MVTTCNSHSPGMIWYQTASLFVPGIMAAAGLLKLVVQAKEVVVPPAFGWLASAGGLISNNPAVARYSLTRAADVDVAGLDNVTLTEILPFEETTDSDVSGLIVEMPLNPFSAILMVSLVE